MQVVKILSVPVSLRREQLVALNHSWQLGSGSYPELHFASIVPKDSKSVSTKAALKAQAPIMEGLWG